MNYKITTWILLVLLIISFAWQKDIFNSNSYQKNNSGMRSYMQSNNQMHTGGHQMQENGMLPDDHSMHMMMSDMTASLKGKKGADLDKAFLEEMIVHHQGAIDMAKELQLGTKRPELLQMADDIIKVQTKEIELMKKWLAEWF